MRSLFLALSITLCRAAFPQTTVELFWSGALAPDHIEVRARLSAETDSVRLAACPWPCLNGPVHSAYSVADSAHDLVAQLVLDDLEPGRAYTYRFEVNGVIDTTVTNTGQFHTPTTGPASFSFVTGSCNGSGEHPVWSAMRARDPLFFLNLGDLHYRDPNSLVLDVHRDPYRVDVLSLSPMKELLHSMPIAYVWDDHDFCGNGSDGSSIGRSNAARAFREYVPHYPLSHPLSVYQAFTIGRVHFILSDLRSTKSPSGMMDIEQFFWLLDQFDHARDHGLLAAWISPLTWNSPDYPENWGGQPAERTLLNDLLYQRDVADLFILSGDAHMLAIDDGLHADFSTAQSQEYLYPIFQAAALCRGGSYKGGTFDQGGYFPNPQAANGQFGEVIVDDDGAEICITFNGWRTDSMSTTINSINTYTFCRTLPSVGVADTTRPARRLHWNSGNGLLVWPGATGNGRIEVFDALGRKADERPLLWIDGHAAFMPSPEANGLLIWRVRAGDQVGVIRCVQ